MSVSNIEALHPTQQDIAPPKKKRSLTRAAREKVIREAIEHFDLDQILADIHTRHPDFVLGRRFIADLERMLIMQRLRQLGVSVAVVCRELGRVS
jgi:hypothetical protein